MKTQTIDLTGASKEKKVPIEFLYYIGGAGIGLTIDNAQYLDDPQEFGYIELICRNYLRDELNPIDLMFAYQVPKDRGAGVLVAGKWNDGIVKESD